MAAQELGEISLIAGDIIDYLPDALGEVKARASRQDRRDYLSHPPGD
jgi:hypothetical protein